MKMLLATLRGLLLLCVAVAMTAGACSSGTDLGAARAELEALAAELGVAPGDLIKATDDPQGFADRPAAHLVGHWQIAGSTEEVVDGVVAAAGRRGFEVRVEAATGQVLVRLDGRRVDVVAQVPTAASSPREVRVAAS